MPVCDIILNNKLKLLTEYEIGQRYNYQMVALVILKTVHIEIIPKLILQVKYKWKPLIN